MGNEVSNEQVSAAGVAAEGLPSESNHDHGSNISGSREQSSAVSPSGSRNSMRALSLANTDDEFASFATPNGTPTASGRPSPSFLLRDSSPDSSFQSPSEYLSSPPTVIRGARSSRASSSADEYGDRNDSLDSSPQHALHARADGTNDPTTTAGASLEDHAWMDPILAAAAAGAASRKSRDALLFQRHEQSAQGDPPHRRRQPFPVDDEWRDSLQTLAMSTRSTVLSCVHMATPVLGEAADIVKRSTGMDESSRMSSKGNGDSGERRGMGNEKRGPLQTDADANVPERHASTIITQGSEQCPDFDQDASFLDDALKDSCRRLASTAQSAGSTFAEIATPILVEAVDAVKLSVADVEETNLEQTLDGKVNKLRDKQSNGDEAAPQVSTCGKAQGGGGSDDAVAEIDWKKSFGRLSSTAKSATASFSQVAAPIFEEAADALQTALPDSVSEVKEQGKYGGVGYRAIVRDSDEGAKVRVHGDGDKPKDEWNESLRRFASNTKGTADSFVSLATPMLSESASVVIGSVKDVAKEISGTFPMSEFKGPVSLEMEDSELHAKFHGSNSIEKQQQLSRVDNPAVSLDDSQDETILASPGWHDKETPLRAHRAPRKIAAGSTIENGRHGLRNVTENIGSLFNSPGSLESPGSTDTPNSIASRTTVSSREKSRRRDRHDALSVTSLSVSSNRSCVSLKRQGPREKNLLSSPGRFVEMVSKRLTSDSSGYPPTHGRERRSRQRMSAGGSRTGSITASPRVVQDGSMQSVFREERQPEMPLSPPDSPQRHSSIHASARNTPPRQPPQEVALWDMVPDSGSRVLGDGRFVIEPRPRIVLARNQDQLQNDMEPGSSFSSEDESLPMSTGFSGRQTIHKVESIDSASEPGDILIRPHRKSRRANQLRQRSSRSSFLPPTMSPSSSAIFSESLNLDTRSTFDEMSPGMCSLQGSDIRSPEADEGSKRSELADTQDKRLDEALMAFSSLEDIDFLDEISTRDIPESLKRLVSLLWRQVTANWEHDETMKAITMRPCSVHWLNRPSLYEDRPHDWTASWTTTAFGTNRDTSFSLHDEFLKSIFHSPLMANLSGYNPLLLDSTQFHYLTSYFAEFGPKCEGDDTMQTDGLVCRRHSLIQEIDGHDVIEIKDLLACAIAKSASYTALIKEIATFATNNADPLNPASALRYSVDVKTADAIVEKANRKYKGDILRVKDVLRGQVTFPNESSLACALVSLRSVCCDVGRSSIGGQEIEVARVKNLFLSPSVAAPKMSSLPTGYRHILVTLKFSDGFLAELQLQLSQMFDILGQDGYSLHKELARIDLPCHESGLLDINQHPCDVHMSKLLRRVLCGQRQSNSQASYLGATREYEPRSPINGSSNAKCIIADPISHQFATNKNGESPTRENQRTSIEAKEADEAEGKKRPPPFRGGSLNIAAAAAQAARSRDQKTSEDMIIDAETVDGESKSNETVGEGTPLVRPSPSLGGELNIAAAAAEAAARKSEKAPDDDSKSNDQGHEGTSLRRPSAFLGGDLNIAAAAAEAARKRQKNSLEGESKPGESVDANKSSEPPSLLGGDLNIAAAAAEAARKRQKNSLEGESKPGESVDANKSSGPPSLLGGGLSIAAAAAEAARKREKRASEVESKPGESVDASKSAGPSSLLRGGLSIAAAAAEAARKREKKTSEVECKSNDTADEGNSIGHPHDFLGEGSIAAAAAETSSEPDVEASSEESKADNASDDKNSLRQPRPLLDGSSIAAAAAEAAKNRKERKAPEAEFATGGRSCVNGSLAGTQATDEDSFCAMFNPVASALDDALSDFRVSLSRPDVMGNEVAELTYASESDPLVEVSGGARLLADGASNELKSFSENDILQSLVLEALRDASGHSRRISTLYCASSLCFVVASLMTHSTVHSCLSGSDEPRDRCSKPSPERTSAPSSIHTGEEVTVIHTPDDSNVESENRKGGDSGSRVYEQEEKKEAHEDSKARPASAGTYPESSSTAVDTTNLLAANKMEHEDEAICTVTIAPLDPSPLFDVSGRALLRSLAVANQASSQGMIGWLEYGSSDFLDRTAGRPLDILKKLACQHALRGEWQVSVDILRALVLRCEQHLPLYHPVTLSSMLDLAAACSSASRRSLAHNVVAQVSERLSFYLAEQEAVFLEFHAAVHDGHDCSDVSFRPETGAEHVKMLHSFASLFEELIGRDYLQVFDEYNDVLLINHCLVGDSFSVLANCLRLSETRRSSETTVSPSCRSDRFWSLACQHYRFALEGWTQKGYSKSHPNVCSVACSVARCLRELGETDRATRILTSVVGFSKQVSLDDQTEGRGVPDTTTDVDTPTKRFLPGRLPHVAPLCTNSPEDSTALNLWYMAAFAVESSPDERGRVRALSLLHASSEALQRGLDNRGERNGDSRDNAYSADMLQCVEDEARELFAPLDSTIDESGVEVFLGDGITSKEIPASQGDATRERFEPYPARRRLHHTGTKASFLPYAFA